METPPTFGSQASTGPPLLRDLRGPARWLATYPMAWGGLLVAWLHAGNGLGSRSDLVWALLVGLVPGLLALGLSFTGSEDRRQYVARVLAAALMLPLLQLMWFGSQDSDHTDVVLWLSMAALALLHAGVVVAAVFWLGACTTAVDAVPGARFVDAGVLTRRWQGLQDAGVPMRMEPVHRPGEPGLTVCVHGLPVPDAARRHQVWMHVDEAARRVRVLEHLHAAGAAPTDAGEADLRAPGERHFDPTRPDASRVWNATRQTTMLLPEHLTWPDLRIEHDSVHLPRSEALDLSAEEVVGLLATVATHSGYHWRPGLGATP